MKKIELYNLVYRQRFERAALMFKESASITLLPVVHNVKSIPNTSVFVYNSIVYGVITNKLP
jgi:hypothetical protein